MYKLIKTQLRELKCSMFHRDSDTVMRPIVVEEKKNDQKGWYIVPGNMEKCKICGRVFKL